MYRKHILHGLRALLGSDSNAIMIICTFFYLTSLELLAILLGYYSSLIIIEKCSAIVGFCSSLIAELVLQLLTFSIYVRQDPMLAI
jgi:hypothetical protein